MMKNSIEIVYKRKKKKEYILNTVRYPNDVYKIVNFFIYLQIHICYVYNSIYFSLFQFIYVYIIDLLSNDYKRNKWYWKNAINHI